MSTAIPTADPLAAWKTGIAKEAHEIVFVTIPAKILALETIIQGWDGNISFIEESLKRYDSTLAAFSYTMMRLNTFLGIQTPRFEDSGKDFGANLINSIGKLITDSISGLPFIEAAYFDKRAERQRKGAPGKAGAEDSLRAMAGRDAIEMAYIKSEFVRLQYGYAYIQILFIKNWETINNPLGKNGHTAMY